MDKPKASSIDIKVLKSKLDIHNNNILFINRCKWEEEKKEEKEELFLKNWKYLNIER